MKIANICFLLKKDEVLLAMKKRGFVVGKWNGPGGKVKTGETVEKSVAREIKEEVGVEVLEKDLEKMGEIEFHFPEQKDWDVFVHIFISRKWKGEARESDEMKPQWFKISEIPLDKMWVDEKYWLPDALSGKKFKARFYFKGSGEEVDSYEIEEEEKEVGAKR